MSGEEMIKLSTAIYNTHFSSYKKLRNDLISCGNYGILKGAKKYDSSRGCESTYLWKCGKNEMICFLRKEIERNKHESCAEIDIDRYFGTIDNDERLEIADLKREILACCCDFREKEKEIVKMLICGTSQTEIAKKYCVSRQFVSLVYKKMIKNVREYYGNDLCKWYDF